MTHPFSRIRPHRGRSLRGHQLLAVAEVAASEAELLVENACLEAQLRAAEEALDRTRRRLCTAEAELRARDRGHDSTRGATAVTVATS